MFQTAPDDDGALGVEHEFDIYEDLELETVVNVPSVSVETTKVRSASVPDVDEAVVPEVVNNSVNPPSVEPRNVDIVSTTSQEIIQKETKSAGT